MRRRLETAGATLGLEGAPLRFLFAALLLAVTVGDLTARPGSLRIAILAVAASMVIGVGFLAPEGLLFGLVAWLAVLAVLRRVVSLSAGSTGTDPLLLIGPFAIAALLMVAMKAGAMNRLTPLSKSVLALNLLTLLGAVNPLGGSTSAGVAGLLFVLIPTLAFWIGRALVDDRTLRRILILIAGLAIPAAGYGLWQTFAGFPSWDQRWIAESEFAALNVDHTIRAFASFSSGAEYAFYLSIAIVILVSFTRSAARLAVTLPAVALIGTALLYESSRTVVVLLAAALGISIAARRGVNPLTALTVGAGTVLVLSLAAGHFAGSGSKSTPSALLSHETQGLANPFDSQSSTALDHVSLVVDGIRTAFTSPIGHGISAVTIAGRKFGGVMQNTEADPSNAAIALGLPGLAAYLGVLVTGLGLMYRTAARRRDTLAMASLGIVLATALEWLNGGQYAVAFLPWLVFGWADRQRALGGQPGETVQ